MGVGFYPRPWACGRHADCVPWACDCGRPWAESHAKLAGSRHLMCKRLGSFVGCLAVVLRRATEVVARVLGRTSARPSAGSGTTGQAQVRPLGQDGAVRRGATSHETKRHACASGVREAWCHDGCTGIASCWNGRGRGLIQEA